MRGGNALKWTQAFRCKVASASSGTSTDVSRYAGQYEHVFEATTAGVTLQAPQLDINTVAAGGGSRLFFRSAHSLFSPVMVILHYKKLQKHQKST